MTFGLAFDLQGESQVERRGTGYRPEIASARAPKWALKIASLHEQLPQP